MSCMTMTLLPITVMFAVMIISFIVMIICLFTDIDTTATRTSITIFVGSFILVGIFAFITDSALKHNPYPVFELSKTEYEFFVENDYSPKKVYEFVKIKNKIKKKEKDDEMVRILSLMSKDVTE